MSEEDLKRLKIKLKDIIKIQSESLFMLNEYTNYFIYLKENKGLKNLKRGYFTLINRLIKNDLFIILNNLCTKESHYSFIKLSCIIESNLKYLDYNKERIKNLKEKLNESIKIFEELNAKDIRDEHCAHIDYKRKSNTVDLSKVYELKNKLISLHNNFSIDLFKLTYSYDNKNDLIELIRDNQMLLSFIEKEKSNN